MSNSTFDEKKALSEAETELAELIKSLEGIQRSASNMSPERLRSYTTKLRSFSLPFEVESVDAQSTESLVAEIEAQIEASFKLSRWATAFLVTMIVIASVSLFAFQDLSLPKWVEPLAFMVPGIASVFGLMMKIRADKKMTESAAVLSEALRRASRRGAA